LLPSKRRVTADAFLPPPAARADAIALQTVAGPRQPIENVSDPQHTLLTFSSALAQHDSSREACVPSHATPATRQRSR